MSDPFTWQPSDEVSAWLSDAFQFTNPDGSRYSYISRASVEEKLAAEYERGHRDGWAIGREWSRDERDLIHEDLRGLLRALGMFDGARPESPHEVMQQAIAKAARLRAAVSA